MKKHGLDLSFGSLSVDNQKDKLILSNHSEKPCFYVLPHIFFNTNHRIELTLYGKEIKGNGCKISLIDRKKRVLLNCPINYTKYSSDLCSRMFIAAITIPSKSIVQIDKLDIENDFDEEKILDDFFVGDTLLISPVYPSNENRYSGGFVHTRAKAYKNNGLKVDIAVIDSSKELSIYEYEGIRIFHANFYNMRQLLQRRHYKRLLIHFFDTNYANVLDSCDLSDTKLYFYLHGAETLYWDWNKITNPYFRRRKDTLSEDLVIDFKHRDEVIKKYNENKNVTWVFVTPWTRKRSEELIKIKYKNSVCIPCWIDETLFKEEEKDVELRKKIFVLRKFENINSYSIDTVVRTILELSRRTFFKELEFDIYGDGSLFDFLLEPLREFDNVKLHRKFLTHEEIREVHETHGIALFPTRFDSQAVSSCEAASSGCVVISSENPGVEQYIPSKYGTLCNPENYQEYANLIEKLFYDKELFKKISREMPKNIRKKCSFKSTIKRELMMFKNEKYFDVECEKWNSDPIITVIIPSYNVEKYLTHTVYSILDQRNRNKVEVLIINDGSKDNTGNIGRELMKKYNNKGMKVVRLINKENGGHGSTINRGIQEARGKYIKIVDGDDTVDSFEFAKLVDILETENVDIILSDYLEDHALDNWRNEMKLYEFLSPGIEYKFEDLCYEEYGFGKWGPLLSTSTYSAKLLKDAKFSLSEKMFYVDMELNTYISLCTQTIKYYPLCIYRYLLGVQGQSVSRLSYTKNYKHHENVTIKLLEILYKNKNISEKRKKYITNKIIIPMITTQYYISLEYVRTREAFNSFDGRLKMFKDFYYDKRVATKDVKFHRRTRAIFVKLKS